MKRPRAADARDRVGDRGRRVDWCVRLDGVDVLGDSGRRSMALCSTLALGLGQRFGLAPEASGWQDRLRYLRHGGLLAHERRRGMLIGPAYEEDRAAKPANRGARAMTCVISRRSARAPPSARAARQALAALLGPAPDNAARRRRLPDDRILSTMAERVFAAGFVWRVIEQKWPGFEEAFLGFEPKRLLFQPDDFWHDLTSDKRIVRNPQKIRSVRDNAAFVERCRREHGSFGKFLAAVAGGRPDRPDGLSRQAWQPARRRRPGSISCAGSAGTPSWSARDMARGAARRRPRHRRDADLEAGPGAGSRSRSTPGRDETGLPCAAHVAHPGACRSARTDSPETLREYMRRR